MPARRIIYRNWIVELGCDPGRFKRGFHDLPPKSNDRIVKAVRAALKKLPGAQKDFIERYYYQGETIPEIAAATGSRPSKLAGLHRRAIARLKKELAEFVSREFGLAPVRPSGCPICDSPVRARLEELLATKTARETWKRIITVLKTDYDLTIKTPQILIGHVKYHPPLKGDCHERSKTA